MEITPNLAGQITAAVSEVVKNDINLINQKGIIIGSTRPERIGSYHEAGARAIETGSPITVDQDALYEGTHKGINYPIYFENNPIAAIGITGNPEELEKFGFLITKITEVFLKEQQLSEEMLSENRSLHYIITSLIHSDIKDPDRLHTLLEQYQINASGKFAALTIKLTDNALEQSLRLFFSNIGCRLALYFYPSEFIVIFDSNSIKQFDSEQFSAKYHGKLYAGLGSSTSLYQLSQSYANARIARHHAQNRGLCFASSENVSIELILESLPLDIRKMYTAHALKGLNDKDRHLLATYFKCSLSLKDTAAALFIHKNTLQYQLDRISEKSGLNPRIFQDAFLLQFALLCLE